MRKCARGRVLIISREICAFARQLDKSNCAPRHDAMLHIGGRVGIIRLSLPPRQVYMRDMSADFTANYLQGAHRHHTHTPAGMRGAHECKHEYRRAAVAVLCGVRLCLLRASARSRDYADVDMDGELAAGVRAIKVLRHPAAPHNRTGVREGREKFSNGDAASCLNDDNSVSQRQISLSFAPSFSLTLSLSLSRSARCTRDSTSANV